MPSLVLRASSAVGAFGSPPVNTVAPVVSGTVRVGSTLSCTTGTWTNSPTSYAYQWLRDGDPISGATSSTYILIEADEGEDISCVVTATNATGSASQVSNEVGPVQEGFQVLFSDGFESGNLSHTEGGVSWSTSVSTAVVTDRPRTGSYSLRFNFAAVPPGEDCTAEQRFSLGGNYPEIWCEYDLYIPENYYHRSDPPSSNNKGFLYLWSGDYGTPSGPGLGPNFWPATGGTSSGSQYAWGPGIDKHFWDSMPNAIEAADRGKWVKIICHYKYASVANNDGVSEIWKVRDGTRYKIMDIQNGDWYVPGQPGFSVGYLFGWANSGFDEQTRLYVDNLIFSTEPLVVEE